MKDGDIEITYGVRPATSNGWLSAIVVNGKERVDWWPGAFDKDMALSMAAAEARTEAARYIGDWNITVTQEAL